MFTINDKNQNRRGSITYYSNGLKQLWTSNQQIKEEVDDIQEIPGGISANEAWKIVGSPPRRMSFSGQGQQVPDNQSNSSSQLLNVDDYATESTRRRNRAASTPLPPINNELFTFSPFSNIKTSEETSETADEYHLLNHSKQWSDVSWSTHGKSIWNNDNNANNGNISKPNVNVTLTNMDDDSSSNSQNNYLFLNNNNGNGNGNGSGNGNTTYPNINITTSANAPMSSSSTTPTPTTKTATEKNNETFGKEKNESSNESIGRFRSSSFSLGTFNIHQTPINEMDESDKIANRSSDLNYLKPNSSNFNNSSGIGFDTNSGNNGNVNNSFLSFPYEMPKSRSRSKSSSEIIGKFSNHSLNSINDIDLISQGYGINDLNSVGGGVNGNNNMLWGNNNINNLNNINNVNFISALLSSRNNSSVNSQLTGMSPLSQLLTNDSSIHRRSSTQPMYSNIWGTNANAMDSTTNSHSNVNNPSSLTMPTSPTAMASPSSAVPTTSMNNLLSPQMNNYFNNLNINANPNVNSSSSTTAAAAATTGSSTTTATATNNNKNMLPSILTTPNNHNQILLNSGLGFNHPNYSNGQTMNDEAMINNENSERRQSLPDPSLYSGLMNVAEKSSNDDSKSKALSTHDSDYINEIDDYFENTEHRTRAWVEAGKHLQPQQTSQHWPIYIIEFKAGRTDYFYISENSGLIVKVNDLVIVEADRGKDLGKVVASNITNFQQIQLFHSQHSEEGSVELQKDMQIHPKRIYRMAQSAEIDMLISKCQDEVKAKNLCQGKVRQRKLPMEIVDAEFQWDRKKLTFYFVSDRRIDFRELVRELFKIYKTRIWMCAVSSISN